MSIQLPGETREQWDRRRRDRLRVRSGDVEPLAGAYVVAHHRDVVGTDAVGRARPRIVEYDLLMDKRTNRVVARRYSDGTVEMFSEPSGRTERTLQSELLVPKREEQPAWQVDGEDHRATDHPARDGDHLRRAWQRARRRPSTAQADLALALTTQLHGQLSKADGRISHWSKARASGGEPGPLGSSTRGTGRSHPGG